MTTLQHPLSEFCPPPQEKRNLLDGLPTGHPATTVIGNLPKVGIFCWVTLPGHTAATVIETPSPKGPTHPATGFPFSCYNFPEKKMADMQQKV